MKLCHFMVSIPGTIEDSSWVVYAATAEEAAELYVRAVLDEEISVDEEEMADCGEVKLDCFPPVPDTPGIVDWAQFSSRTISLSSISAWATREVDPDDPEQGF